MAYNGYLIKVGTYTIPNKYIAPGFKSVLNSQDIDSYRDANGILHRNSLQHKVAKIDFNTPVLYGYQFNELMDGIRRNYINEIEKKLNCLVFVPEINDYVTQEMYFIDPEPSMYAVWSKNIIYNSTRLAFIGY